MKKTLDIEQLVDPENLAVEISNKFTTWDALRSGWKQEKVELRNYIFATDTKTTSNQANPWFNNQTTPKLTSIYDTLKAVYSAALFPNSEWLRWMGDDAEAETQSKKIAIQSYMENKNRQSKYVSVVDSILDDWIIYGNAFATVEFVSEYIELEGETIAGYIGPRTKRISPYDIVFDPTASTFENTPKIIRTLVSLGEVQKMAEGGDQVMVEVSNRIRQNRVAVANGSGVSMEKSDAFVADGFGSIESYYASEYVELLTFYGDIFDKNTGELKSNRKVTVVDRAYVISDEPIASWLGSAPIFHSGWRARPDNLWAMGPLDNLVGMQYRIDHLENLKSDVFDQIAFPVLKIRGDVPDFEYAPGERIYLGEEGDVTTLVPDATALNAQLQIQVLEQKMEELAGAPKQALGIRTPGEKTAFEVQTLENSSGRIFQHKATKFENEIVTPTQQNMLEASRRNMDTADLIRVLDDATGAVLFKSITKDDLMAKGSLYPVGARHFTERAQRIQNINNLLQMRGDPSIGVHMSGRAIARIMSEELAEPDLYSENIGVEENAETQKAALDAEANIQEELQVAAEEGL